MPVTPTYPGVYIQELASDVRTVVPVDTATTAFIGTALRGPVNDPVTIFGFDEFERQFGGLWIDSKLGFAVRDFFLNGGSKAIIVRAFWAKEGDAKSEPALLALSSPAEGATTSPPQIAAASVGRWGEKLVLRVTKEEDDKVLTQLASQFDVDKAELFNLTIRDLKTSAEEYYPNVTLSEGPRRLDRVLSAQSQLVRVPVGVLDSYEGGPPEVHPEPAAKKSWWDTTNDPKTCSIVATPVSNGELEAEADKDVVITAAIKALDHVDIFNMLCIPPYASDTVSAGVLAEALAYCEKRRAMLIIDPPAGWKSPEIKPEQFPIPELAPSANAAIFFPRLRKRNPLRDNQVEEFVPCGAVAGVMARTDLRRGVWKAAAGLEATLNGVEGFSVQIDDDRNGLLNPRGINCLRIMPGAGPVVWGARTTVGDDRLANQWKYVPVRRMALWIEETLYRSTQWAVFEPNDEPLWSSLRLNIGNFMNGLFRQGAFQGKAPAQAYFVKCDATTTTQADIDRGIVNVVVGFAPLKPAEFVIISIQQITNQGAA